MIDWLEHCRRVFNYGLRERKDWIRSRKCEINCCSIEREYIIPVDIRVSASNFVLKSTEYFAELWGKCI